MSNMVAVEVAHRPVVDGKGTVAVEVHTMPEHEVTDFIVNLPDHKWVNDEWNV